MKFSRDIKKKKKKNRSKTRTREVYDIGFAAAIKLRDRHQIISSTVRAMSVFFYAIVNDEPRAKFQNGANYLPVVLPN